MAIFFIIILLLTEINTAQNMDFEQSIYSEYEVYKEPTLKCRRFKHADILPLINNLEKNGKFKITKAGQSAEGRDIFLLSLGKGSVKIFCWSQMHGDEATATMALFDLFNFFSAGDRYNEFRENLLNKSTLYFMPMVNPDGAELFQRRNIFDIDLNRDAVRKQTPEARVLKNTFDSLKADFGFNLHDQKIYYSAGNSFKSAAISFLAPTINYEKTADTVRENAMKVIAHMYSTLSHFIPGHIAKYSDEFEPRAFGDNFQKWGTSTILIESGGWKNDTEKQFIRKLNFIALLSAFKSIVTGSYKAETTDDYEKIPFNQELLNDLLLKNLTFRKNGSVFLTDVSVNREEINLTGAKDFYYKSTVEDFGDLSVYSGYEEYDLKGFEITAGKIFSKKFSSFEEIKKLDFSELHKKGFTSVILVQDSLDLEFSPLPINIILNKAEKPAEEIKLEQCADLLITKNNNIKYLVVNGFFIDIDQPDYRNINGMIFK